MLSFTIKNPWKISIIKLPCDRSHSANVIGNVGKIRSNLCAVGKNSNHGTCTFENEFEGAESHIATTCAQGVTGDSCDMLNLLILVIS